MRVRRALLTLAVALPLVTACTPSDPAITPVDEQAVIRVGAGEDLRLEVIATLMAQALRYEGYQAEVVATDDLQGALDGGEVDVIPQCTGSLLAQFDPQRAELLLTGENRGGEVFTTAETPLTRDELSYVTLVSATESLPTRWLVGDPGAAEGCGDSTDPERRVTEVAELPQFVLPVYREGVIAYGSWKALNIVAGTLNQELLDELVASAAADGLDAEPITEYLPRLGWRTPRDTPE